MNFPSALVRAVFRAGLLGSVSVSATAACGMTGDAASERDDDYTVRPTGGSTELIVVPPTGSTPATLRLHRSSGSASAEEFSPGVALATSPGEGTLFVSVEGHPTGSPLRLGLAAGTRTSVKLPGLMFRRRTTDRVVGIDVARCTSSFSQPGCDWSGGAPAQAWIRTQLTDARLVPFGPGAWFESLGPYALKGELAEAQIGNIEIDVTTGRRAIRIVPPTSREFDDVENGFVLTTTTRASGDYQWVSERLRNVGTKPLLFIVEDEHVARYDTFLLPTAIVAGSTALPEIRFQRLDVDDVEITLPNGSKTMVVGKFVAQRRSTGTNDRFTATGPTKHGVDVPPGTYDVTVDYKHPLDGRDARYTVSVELL